MFSNMSWLVLLLSWVFWLVVIGVIAWALIKALRKSKTDSSLPNQDETLIDSDVSKEEFEQSKPKHENP